VDDGPSEPIDLGAWFTDVIAEYTVLAGAPSPDTPWPLVFALARRAKQFHDRTQLAVMDAADAALQAALGQHGAVTGLRDQLQASAWPRQGKRPDPFVPNAFAEGSDG
jgi:hypothetical protein